MPKYELKINNREKIHDDLKTTFGDKYLRFNSPTSIETSEPLTDEELKRAQDIFDGRHALDIWEPSKLRNLTKAEAEAKIDAVQSLADAKKVLKTLTRIVLWLLKREMREI